MDKKADTYQATPFTDAEDSANHPQKINVHTDHQQARKEMRQNSSGKLLAGNGNLPIHRKNQRCDYTPRPPKRKRKKQSATSAVTGRQIRQGKHSRESSMPERHGPSSLDASSIVCQPWRFSLCCQMNSFRIRQAQHQSPSEEVVRDRNGNLIIARFQRQREGAIFQ
jgi:hypothetical protein